jgi:hypothetical protein
MSDTSVSIGRIRVAIDLVYYFGTRVYNTVNCITSSFMISPDIIGVNKPRSRRAEHVACMKGRRSEHRVLVWRPEIKRPLGRP